jgi:glycogen phosphorylase
MSSDIQKAAASTSHMSANARELRRDFLFNLFTRQAAFLEIATTNDLYTALAYTVRDRMLQQFIHSAHSYYQDASRTVAYLSAEYLVGPQLGYNLVTLGMYNDAKEALGQLGISVDELIEFEREPGLGNGGLGRLAACYMDSLATLRVPAIGYGLRYEFGTFRQSIVDGRQVESIDHWARLTYPWEVPRPHLEYDVKLGGHTEPGVDAHGRYQVRWIAERVVKGMACDTPVHGYGVENTNMMRLWQAAATESLDLSAFNKGDYYGAVHQKVASENISKVLYPNDQPEAGKVLRLEQQYFLVSCSLQDMIRLHLQRASSLDTFADKYAIQLNDTHPVLAIPELMRLLVDEHGVNWDKAYEITSACMGYTNHTLLPEALETWPLQLFKRILPRHLEIIYELNHRFLDRVRRRYPGDNERIARMSMLGQTEHEGVRMANIACAVSHAVNGVSELHSRLLRQSVLPDFYDMWPEKFSNVTNGVTQRRFMLLANPKLSELITEAIGDTWTSDCNALSGLERFADDAAFVDKFKAVRRANKVQLGSIFEHQLGVRVDPDALFDVQIKRIHEYKRQHLNILRVITLYRHLKEKRALSEVPRVVIFSGKAAPGYYMAKLIIQLIADVASFINLDESVAKQLRVLFVPDLNVKVAQRIYPAADLSEQISLAGKEASGTGNMKFAMNGAVTIGTLDGANVEIRERVGAENFFLFGLTAEQVMEKRKRGYNPRALYENNPELRATIDLINSGTFSHGERDRYAPLMNALLDHDPFMVLADFDAYLTAQRLAAEQYAHRTLLARKGILNVARVGYFSSDRAVAEYCKQIWHVSPVDLQVGHNHFYTSYPPPARLTSSHPPRHTLLPNKGAENSQGKLPTAAGDLAED